MSELANTKVELLPTVGFLLYSYRMHNTKLQDCTICFLVKNTLQKLWNRACLRVSHNALLWKSQTHWVNDSIYKLSISEYSSEILHCGNVINMPYWRKEIYCNNNRQSAASLISNYYLSEQHSYFQDSASEVIITISDCREHEGDQSKS